MTKKKGGGFPKGAPVPTSEFRNQEEIDRTDGMTAGNATGIKLRYGPFGFIRGAKAWIGGTIRFGFSRKYRQEQRLKKAVARHQARLNQSRSRK